MPKKESVTPNQKQMEKFIGENEARFNALFSSYGIVYFEFDDNGDILRMLDPSRVMKVNPTLKDGGVDEG